MSKKLEVKRIDQLDIANLKEIVAVSNCIGDFSDRFHTLSVEHYEVIDASNTEYPRLFITAMLVVTGDGIVDIVYAATIMFKDKSGVMTIHFGSDVQETPNMPLTFSGIYLKQKDNVSLGVGRFGDLAKKAIMNIDVAVRRGREVGYNISEYLQKL